MIPSEKREFKDNSHHTIVSKKGLRIICISPSFIPVADSEAFSGGKIVLALQEEGVDVQVISYITSNHSQVLDSSSFWDPLRATTHPLPAAGKCGLMTRAHATLRVQTRSYARWNQAAVEHAQKLHAQKPFDIVYSRSLPYFAHVAGYWVSRNLRLPWIANINDPWDLHLFPDGAAVPANLLHRLDSEFWLRRTLRCADRITFCSKRLANYHARLSKIERKFEVIPHVGYAAANCKARPRFTLVHAGKLGMNELTKRPVQALLRGLREFFNQTPTARSQTQLLLVGPEDPHTTSLAENLGIFTKVRSLGRVNFETSLDYIGSAHVCILLEGSMREGIYLPSKLADYIVAGKVVLASSPSIGEIADIGPTQGVFRVDNNDPTAVCQMIGKFYRAFQEGTLSRFSPPPDLQERYSAPMIAKRFLDLADQMITERSIIKSCI